jgi:predicted unusual protein kinase regulating ubiquinone biosynthesis (AarF/ABC1/UbiB family)
MPTRTPRINRLFQMVRFLRVARLLFWTIWVIYRERRRVVRAHARGDYTERPNSDVLIEVLVAFREAAVELGVLMIKLGQFLSSRVDLLPEKAIGILSSLQDEMPPAPFEHVVSLIEAELGKPVEEVFSMLERKCTAAASLGQVHKAVLASTGETVAVKIQRPTSDQLARTDLSALKFVIWIITRFVDMNHFIDLMGVYHEFKRTVYEELDYIREAANASQTFFGMIMNHAYILSTQHSLHPAPLVLHSAPECSQHLPSSYCPLIGTPQAPGLSIPA